MIWVLAAACAAASIPAGLRWLRIAQREHYLDGYVSRFAWRWWSSGPTNPILLVLGLVGVVGTLWDARSGFLVVATQFGPIGLPAKGVTSPLAWTSRLRRVAVLLGLFAIAGYVIGALAGAPIVIAATLFALPALVDLSLVLLGPVENRLSARWVDKAAAKLEAIGPDVVAITGSFGKTTTKNYVAHLLGGSLRTVASPASFNNRMGLAKAINENLTPGTEVFIAEMGTYGPGEIAELCSWIRPRVAAMVAIGPVHLERFGTEERIASAKAEILDGADVGVINVDHPLLAAIAKERAASMTVIEVSVAEGTVNVDGEMVMKVPERAFAVNLAVAIGIGLALGVPRDELIARTADLPGAQHRLSVIESESGVTIIDDTFNSNPAGARSGLALLERSTKDGRTVLVTPGMVELGPVQYTENESFARAAAASVDDLLIVGLTNRKALLRGSAEGKAAVTVVDSRDEAVKWVRGNLEPGDAVLYENDLPDHYP